MKSIITAEELLQRLNNTQAVLRERMEMNDRKLTDAENEALNKMANDYFNVGINIINKMPKEKLYRDFMVFKRIESKDIWWLPIWRTCNSFAKGNKAKVSSLKMGVYFLILEDLRKPIAMYPNKMCPNDVYSNVRSSVSEIHEDYAKLLETSVKKVSFAFSELERYGYIRKIDANYKCSIRGENGDEEYCVKGVVYVPCKVYCAIVDGRKIAFSERRL